MPGTPLPSHPFLTYSISSRTIICSSHMSATSRNKHFIQLFCGDEHAGTWHTLPLTFDSALEGYYVDHGRQHGFWVSRLAYCKVAEEALHEFLLLDINAPRESVPRGLILIERTRGAVAVLDIRWLYNIQTSGAAVNGVLVSHFSSDLPDRAVRNVSAASHLPQFPASSSHSSLANAVSIPARDHAVLINNVRDIQRHENRRYEVLAEICFDGGEVTLAHALAAGYTVQHADANYRVLGTQCYWFALMVGDLISGGRLSQTLLRSHGGRYRLGSLEPTVVFPQEVTNHAHSLRDQYSDAIRRLSHLRSRREDAQEGADTRGRLHAESRRADRAEEERARVERENLELQRRIRVLEASSANRR